MAESHSKVLEAKPPRDLDPSLEAETLLTESESPASIPRVAQSGQENHSATMS